MFKRLMAISAGATLALTGTMATAQTCGKREDLVDKLQGKYLEQMRMGGLQATRGKHAMMELWTSEETGTFTVLVTRADGTSCVLAAGTDAFFTDPEARPAGVQG
ncbi:hypothetical protein K1T73_00680 [Roseovarius sp. SCSIO 43702]|uniref:hypothetical protein n=1 Tax=Roseovarius sp. SCSIO 43702 TaxID=2823043 RepID=UPI001C72EFCF|nr:hypothetical protein [Roseovarius sp. SCSIO 43702]QYX56969.1 hypothetical protein K1T73_00680 [Roseovarius sp. SCSIO 43702]